MNSSVMIINGVGGQELTHQHAINSAKDYMIGKKFIEAGHSPDKKTVSNPDSNLKELL